MTKYMVALLMAGYMFLGVAPVKANDVKPLTIDGHKYYLHVPRSVVKVSSNDTSTAASAGLLLWLHSGGIGAKDQFDWWLKSKQFDKEVILLCPEAINIASGWNVERDMTFVRSVLDQTVKEYGIPASRIVIAGHSQGGSHAWWLALQMQEKIAAILACKCLAPLPPPQAAQPKQPRTVWYYADNDPYVPMAKPVESKAQMEKAGYAIEVFKDNLKHALGPKAQELHDMLRKWIAEQQNQKQNKPDAGDGK
jgi:predicted esterase